VILHFRVMPEVPQSMQDGLANLELEANKEGHRVSSMSNSSTFSQYPDQHGADPSPRRVPGAYTASYEHTNASAYQNVRGSTGSDGVPYNQPSPKSSVFPKLRDAGQNVPMSDDEKEEVLERARPMVLNSNDPNMQLAWAQDALTWVEVAKQARANEGQDTRSSTPKIEHQLRVDALSIVNFLAEQHHPKAEFMKGMWLEFGKFGYPVDKKEAFLSYRRAADTNTHGTGIYARAEYRMGMQFESTGDIVKAIKHYRQGVAMQDSASNYRLGMMTLLGQHGQPLDYQKGIALIRYSADTADENAPQGAYVYGMLLARELPNITIPGQYLAVDIAKAKEYIEKAAYLGFAKAQLKMGQAYELCQLGCDFNPALSLHYDALAARQGEAEADMAISKWFLCGYEGIFEKNEELAFKYAQRAAATGMPTAEFAMGYFYEIGMFVPADIQLAQSWYKKASEHGNKDASARLDSISQEKTLSKSDHEQIAISRIKSKYGSQRGQRPDRFQQKPAPMATIPDAAMPEPPRHSSMASTPGMINTQKNYPTARPASAAPYPMDDGPASAGPQPPLSPYYNPGVRPSAGAPSERSSSAFGIKHATTMPPQQPSIPADPMRPSTSMGSLGAPGGGRSPNAAGRAVSAGWEPQQSTGYGIPPQGRAASQPFDPRTSSQRPVSSMNKSPGYPPAPNAYGRAPAQNYDQRAGTPQSASRPPRVDSAPPPHSSSRPSTAQSAPAVNANPPRVSSAASGASAATAPPAPKPAKTGPQTFEEMGVPAQKQDQDCVSRFFSS
jgi:TPR repeat protein